MLGGLERLTRRWRSNASPDAGDSDTALRGLAPETPPSRTAVRAALRGLHGLLGRIGRLIPGVRRRLADDPDLFLLVAVVTAVVVVIEIARPASGTAPEESIEEVGDPSGSGGGPPDGDVLGVPDEGDDAGERAPAGEPVRRISEPVRRAEALARVSSAEIRAEVGTEVVLAVRLSGTRGRPVEDEVVRWRVEGGGALEERDVRTDMQGIARARVRLPEAPGPLRVVAAARGGDLPEVDFQVTAIPRRR